MPLTLSTRSRLWKLSESLGGRIGPHHQVARAQPHPPDLGLGDVDVVRAGHPVPVEAQEAVPVVHDLQHPGADHLGALGGAVALALAVPLALPLPLRLPLRLPLGGAVAVPLPLALALPPLLAHPRPVASSRWWRAWRGPRGARPREPARWSGGARPPGWPARGGPAGGGRSAPASSRRPARGSLPPGPGHAARRSTSVLALCIARSVLLRRGADETGYWAAAGRGPSPGAARRRRGEGQCPPRRRAQGAVRVTDAPFRGHRHRDGELLRGTRDATSRAP